MKQGARHDGSGEDQRAADSLESACEEKLADAIFGANLTLKVRVNASLARMNAQQNDILPAQLVFLSSDAVDTLILEEVTA